MENRPEVPLKELPYFSMWRQIDGVPVKVSAKLIAWPDACCCCLGEPEEKYAVSFNRSFSKRGKHSQEWRLPICSRCASHHITATSHLKTVSTFKKLLWWLFVVFFLFIGWYFFRGVYSHLFAEIFFVILAASAVVIWFAAKSSSSTRKNMTNNCCSPLDPVLYLGWDHTIHKFLFLNPEYAALFVSANKKKLAD